MMSPIADCDDKLADNLNANAVRGAVNEANAIFQAFASKFPDENAKKLAVRFTDLVMDIAAWLKPLSDNILKEKLDKLKVTDLSNESSINGKKDQPPNPK